MECKDYRKQLKGYALGFMKGPEKEELEAHVEHCPICIRELSMWQDVLEKQKDLNLEKENMRLADKVRETAGKLDSDILMAPSARRLNYVAKTLKSPAGLIVVVITAVIFGIAALFLLIKKDVSPLFYVFMITGGISLIFIAIRSYFLKKKK